MTLTYNDYQNVIVTTLMIRELIRFNLVSFTDHGWWLVNGGFRMRFVCQSVSGPVIIPAKAKRPPHSILNVINELAGTHFKKFHMAPVISR
jgi:hypothetical protein